MTDDHATLAAFILAPIIPAVVFALSSPGLGGGLGADLVALVALSAIGYFYSFFAVALLGLPTFLFMHRCGLDGPAASVTCSAILGLFVAYILVPRVSYWSTLDWLWEIKGLVVTSSGTGMAFWASRMFCLNAGRSKS